MRPERAPDQPPHHRQQHEVTEHVVERLQIERAAVLGAGVMGAGLAAHLASCGIPVLLLDVVPGSLLPREQAAGLTLKDAVVRSRLARDGVQRALRSNPASFQSPRAVALVTAGNLEDDLPKLAGADWVIEAVVEDLGIKRSLFERIVPHLAPHALLTSNTSGLPCKELSATLPPERARRFFITHFFNPPRYLHLLELVSGPDTDAGLLPAFAEFAEQVLGKGCVTCKDTPNFIANRLGTFSFLHLLRTLQRGEASVAEIDALTGELIGRPRSATFRTADLVGLDTLLAVTKHLHAALPEPARAPFAPPELLVKLVERKQLGVKTGAGFYRKLESGGRSVLQMLDPATLDYVALPEPAWPGLEKVARAADPAAGMAALAEVAPRAAALLSNHLGASLAYAAQCVPEISDDIVSVDRALRWGFGWTAGPFELWDQSGVAATAQRLSSAGQRVPPLVTALLQSGATSFYQRDPAGLLAYDPAAARAVRVPPRDGVLLLEDRVRAGGVVEKNAEAALIDLGEDVLCLQFRTRMNVIGQHTGELLGKALRLLADRGSAWRGLVIGNEGEHFSAGANLHLVLALAEAKNFQALNQLVSGFQQLNQAIQHGPRPVVLACQGMTLGGGCEMLLHATRVCAAAESYIGLVEAGAGLIPAAGGCKELVRRLDASLPEDLEHVDLLPFVQRLFRNVAMGRVSGSALEARELSFLSAADRIVPSRERLLSAARQAVLDAARDGYRPRPPRQDLRVLGGAGIAALHVALWNMLEARMISDHDAAVAGRLAHVLCGGEVAHATRVSEQHLLDLEREAFVSLAGEPLTHARMKALLTTGKPLRN